MKKLLIILVLLLTFFTGCATNTQQNNFSKEDFSETHFKNFSDIKNIIHHLESNKENVTVLSETEEQLIICFSDNSENSSLLSYAETLETAGYELTVLDATISSTILLENDIHKVSITTISDITAYKQLHTEIDNIDKMTDENLVFKILKK